MREMITKDKEQLAESLYNAFGVASNWKKSNGDSMPIWKQMEDQEQYGWRAVADHVKYLYEFPFKS